MAATNACVSASPCSLPTARRASPPSAALSAATSTTAGCCAPKITARAPAPVAQAPLNSSVLETGCLLAEANSSRTAPGSSGPSWARSTTVIVAATRLMLIPVGEPAATRTAPPGPTSWSDAHDGMSVPAVLNPWFSRSTAASVIPVD